MSGVRSGSSAGPGSSRLAAGSWAVPFADPRAHMAVARTAMKGPQPCRTSPTQHPLGKTVTRWVDQPLWPGVPAGSSSGMYPATEIHLHLGHVGAAHRQVLATFGYAFRPLHPGTNLLPRRNESTVAVDRPGRRMKRRPRGRSRSPTTRDRPVSGRCPPSTTRRAGRRAPQQITQFAPSRRHDSERASPHLHHDTE
jgi:hypothetical protein